MDSLADIPGGDMDAAGRNRVAVNQATLRKINEGIDGEREDGLTAFLCECGKIGCNRLIMLLRAQYDAVRATPRSFPAAPRHIVGELEHVVEQHPDSTVVETHPDTPHIAEQT